MNYVEHIKLKIPNFIEVLKNEGIENGKKYFEENLEYLIEKIKGDDSDWYKDNLEYFVEIRDMLYSHPNFSNPARSTEESISIIEEMIKED
jgi:hypothetical protein